MLLPGRPTERLSCVSSVFVERGPLRFGFPLRGSSRSPTTALSLGGRWRASTSQAVCKTRQTQECVGFAACARRFQFTAFARTFSAATLDLFSCRLELLMENMPEYTANL